MFSGIIGAATLTMAWFVQPVLMKLETPTSYYGVIWTVLNLTVGLSALYSDQVERYFGMRKSNTFILLIIVGGYISLAYNLTYWGLAILFIFYIVPVSYTHLVIVATAQSLKLHGCVPEKEIKEPNIEGLKNGFTNLDKHIENMKSFGQQVIVTFNRFATDTDEEIALVAEHCKEKGVGFAMNNVFSEGGEGGTELARLVVDTIENHPSATLQYTYDLNDPIRTKVQKVAQKIYGALSLIHIFFPLSDPTV